MNTTSTALPKVKYTAMDKIKAIGPAVVITGSFIGPGTVTVHQQGLRRKCFPDNSR